MAALWTCGVCDAVMQARIPLIACTSCRNWVHLKCQWGSSHKNFSSFIFHLQQILKCKVIFYSHSGDYVARAYLFILLILFDLKILLLLRFNHWEWWTCNLIFHRSLVPNRYCQKNDIFRNNWKLDNSPYK